jgi:hypothetical protein
VGRHVKNVYLDTCILIYRVEGAEAQKRAAEQALLSLVQGEARISPLVKLECLVKPLREGDEQLCALYRSLLATFTSLSFSSAVFELGAELRAPTGSRRRTRFTQPEPFITTVTSSASLAIFPAHRRIFLVPFAIFRIFGDLPSPPVRSSSIEPRSCPWNFCFNPSHCCPIGHGTIGPLS